MQDPPPKGTWRAFTLLGGLVPLDFSYKQSQ